MQLMENIIKEAKEESRYPRAQNGLYFGFLDETLIDNLNENNQWKVWRHLFRYNIIRNEQTLLKPLKANFIQFLLMTEKWIFYPTLLTLWASWSNLSQISTLRFLWRPLKSFVTYITLIILGKLLQ